MYGPYNIGEEWQVSADQFCYILRKKRVVKSGDNKGTESWDLEGYYGRVDRLLNAILNNELMENLGDMRLAIERIDAIEQHLEVLIKIKQEREASWA